MEEFRYGDQGSGGVMPENGQMVPDFTLPSTCGPLTLSQLWQERKVVLAFYIEDDTPG